MRCFRFFYHGGGRNSRGRRAIAREIAPRESPSTQGMLGGGWSRTAHSHKSGRIVTQRGAGSGSGILRFRKVNLATRAWVSIPTSSSRSREGDRTLGETKKGRNEGWSGAQPFQLLGVWIAVAGRWELKRPGGPSGGSDITKADATTVSIARVNQIGVSRAGFSESAPFPTTATLASTIQSPSGR